jgi:hypothetical protein
MWQVVAPAALYVRGLFPSGEEFVLRHAPEYSSGIINGSV